MRGYRLLPGEVNIGDGVIFIYAVSVPPRPAFKVKKPWWSVAFYEDRLRAFDTIVHQGQLKTFVMSPGAYILRYDMLFPPPQSLDIRASFVEGDDFPLSLYHDQGTADIAGQTNPVLYFEPTAWCEGPGYADIVIEHSTDMKIWEAGSTIKLDQSKPGPLSFEITPRKRYIRWTFEPTDVTGFGMFGNIHIEGQSIHRR